MRRSCDVIISSETLHLEAKINIECFLMVKTLRKCIILFHYRNTPHTGLDSVSKRPLLNEGGNSIMNIEFRLSKYEATGL